MEQPKIQTTILFGQRHQREAATRAASHQLSFATRHPRLSSLTTRRMGCGFDLFIQAFLSFSPIPDDERRSIHTRFTPLTTIARLPSPGDGQVNKTDIGRDVADIFRYEEEFFAFKTRLLTSLFVDEIIYANFQIDLKSIRKFWLATEFPLFSKVFLSKEKNRWLSIEYGDIISTSGYLLPTARPLISNILLDGVTDESINR